MSLSIARVAATAVVFLVFVGAAIISLGSIERPTYWFPAFVAVAGALSSAYALGVDLRKVLTGRSAVDDEVTDLGASIADVADSDDAGERSAVRRRVLVWIAWFVALPAVSLVVPFFYASLVWLFCVLRFSGKRSWVFCIVSVIVFGVVVNGLIVLLQIRVPPALLTGWG
ncbi:hypothetical protein GCM10011490_17450 [Pseudoclavibacter endophyticus]|uniref:Tripartite tricarboxylate transporter TctB family protein n=1 Tax=Pseudoclavibacter endophyticus TaxID=1778590 RepID=A0A6H9WHW7_9MICO|nr:hypothetical protein [Pseudoclavibacter endophyticus]KAB1648903.1 hypothetical protein F8O04_00935 [Pseudoclavibacter endophyticus]GGA67377.1 hypothetical protein GCM10011490_17450 [Pseudoclavibacter endophyticus]